ncbi:hypothetical protein BJ978_000435 [Agromyces terreus]|uniref:Uncharacterized protein n=1 Tax=Agromyces terreus TaxID=424795 RepID=A0A9X2KAN3_9MICO|nr:hypothetical protein [Agromyces terreus]MCP2369759.1 hypothetical protein [Agromyces terreus]
MLAAGLFLVSAGLQLAASLERWVVARDAWTRTDLWVEDHRFDYSFPADPWENLGAAAEMFGAGTVLLALGIMAMTRAVEGSVDGLIGLLAGVTAAGFAVSGLHALLSGLIDAPSPLQFLPVQLFLGAIGFVGLGILASIWWRASPATAVACVMLLGATLPGTLLAAFQIAPAIVGSQSYDTTAWTETIVAAVPGGAGLAMLTAAAAAALPRGVARRPRNLSAASGG